MMRKCNENPMLFPHQKTEPGSRVKFQKEGQIFEAKITSRTFMDRCRFLLIIECDHKKNRLWWIRGKFYWGSVDGTPVTLI